MTKSLVAIIPARSGSKRVTRKNTREFTPDGKSLLDIKIETLQKVNGIDYIVVNSDSNDILMDVKARYGVMTVLREADKASDHVRGNEFLYDIFKSIDAEHILYASCTVPFLSVKSYENMISIYMNNVDKNDSLSSTRYCKDFLWENGINKSPVNYKVEDAPNSQELKNILALTFGCMLINKRTAIERQYFVGHKPAFYILTDELENFDIDTQLEFDFARNYVASTDITNNVI